MSRLNERKDINWKGMMTWILIIIFFALLVYVVMNAYAFTQDPCMYCMEKTGKVCMENFTNSFLKAYN